MRENPAPKTLPKILLLLLPVLACAPPDMADSLQSIGNGWEDYQPGEIVYARVHSAPDRLYLDVPGGDVSLDNTLLWASYGDVSDQYLHITPQHVLRVQVHDSEWVRILPETYDGRQYRSPFVESADRPVYIAMSDLSPMSDSEFTPLPTRSGAPPQDKLIVLLARGHRGHNGQPKVFLFEGSELVLATPAVLGDTPLGDFRVYLTRASDNMPALPGVPFVAYFTGGYALHGAPWWNWANRSRGGYGSHGCANLPDDEWHTLSVDSTQISVAQWVYRWVSTNIDYDESDGQSEYAYIEWNEDGWYDGSRSVRTLVIEDIRDLNLHPTPARFGATVDRWTTIIDQVASLGDNWRLPTIVGDVLTTRDVPENHPLQPPGLWNDAYVMLPCDASESWPLPAYEGSTRTVQTVCEHLRVDRRGSICTPERVDWEFLGTKVLCNRRQFETADLFLRGELIEHENVHLEQFSGVFGELVRSGVDADDPTPNTITAAQNSVIGITELMAQTRVLERNPEDSVLGNDYEFALARPNGDGIPELVDRRVSVADAWEHLHRECQDDTREDPALRRQLHRAALGDATAYEQLSQRCSMPLHRLIPDRTR